MLVDFETCCELLKNGSVVAIHTETVYGLAANALCPTAVKKIYQTKGRPAQNPLIVHILNSARARSLAFTNEYFFSLAEEFWPGPLTFILESKDIVPKITTGGLNTIALRSPESDVFRNVLRKTNLPLAAPSANPTNKLSPTTAQHVLDNFKSDCPKVLDGGSCREGIESTVLDISKGKPRILRPGPVDPHDIENHLGQKVEITHLKSNDGKSPGNSLTHYSPITPTKVFLNQTKLLAEINSSKDQIFIFPFGKMCKSPKRPNILVISESNSREELLRNLYSTLHDADKKNLAAINICLLPPTCNQYVVYNDRIKRAGTIIN